MTKHNEGSPSSTVSLLELKSSTLSSIFTSPTLLVTFVTILAMEATFILVFVYGIGCYASFRPPRGMWEKAHSQDRNLVEVFL